MEYRATGGDGWTDTAADGRVRMPFGKHRGRPLDEVPDSYLVWILDNLDLTDRPTLREAIRRRLNLDRPAGSVPPGVDVGKAIKTWYRKLAFDFHPDRRKGSNEAMLAINEAYERLCKDLKL